MSQNEALRAFVESVGKPPVSRETDALEAVLRPIVEGQLRSFLADHPSILKGVDWFKPRQDKGVTFVGSVAKRIMNDLLCPQTRARLRAALVETEPAGAADPAGL